MISSSLSTILYSKTSFVFMSLEICVMDLLLIEAREGFCLGDIGVAATNMRTSETTRNALDKDGT
jgi:hypothetical protein